MSHADNVSNTTYREHKNIRRKELHRIRRAAETLEQCKERRRVEKSSFEPYYFIISTL